MPFGIGSEFAPACFLLTEDFGFCACIKLALNLGEIGGLDLVPPNDLLSMGSSSSGPSLVPLNDLLSMRPSSSGSVCSLEDCIFFLVPLLFAIVGTCACIALKLKSSGGVSATEVRLCPVGVLVGSLRPPSEALSAAAAFLAAGAATLAATAAFLAAEKS